MNRNELTGGITLSNKDVRLDPMAVEAQKQWEQTGTVSTSYLEYVLGDVTQGVSPFAEPKIAGKAPDHASKGRKTT